MSAQPNGGAYALGQSEAEERRLQRQAALYALPTRRLFEAAGIGPGMTVLDLGSGAGDVAMLAAEMVGPTGSVLGVDMNPTILETARRRAKAAGHTNATFVAGDIRAVPLDHELDAVVGRLILCHLPDPAAVLRHLLPHLRPGGVAAFYEIDLTVPGASYPPTDLSAAVFRWAARGLTAAGIEPAMGMKLHQVFVEAGFEAPQVAVDALAGGSRAAIEEFTAYGAATVRTLLPVLVKAGIATEDEIGIETLAGRLRDDLLAHGSMIRSHLYMGAWARKAPPA